MPIYKNKNDNTYFFSTRYKDVFGNNKRKVKRGFKTKKAAKLAESKFIRQVNEGYSDSNTYEHVFYHYLDNSNMRPKTRRRKENEYKKHVQDKFGNIKMNKIKQNQCQTFRTYLINHFDSTNSARTVWSGFKAVINYARKHFGLIYDPTISIDPIPRTKPKPKYILREEFDTLVNEIEEVDYQEILKLMYYTGLRVGEAMALTWNDFNRFKKEISIDKSLDTSTRKVFPRAKTESSEDVVPLPAFINEMLINKFEREKQHYKYFKNEYFIFGGVQPLHYSHLHKKYKRVFTKYDIHTLRHSYATYLANNGVDIFVLKSLMRHSRITETLETYSHLYTEKKHNAIRIFDTLKK